MHLWVHVRVDADQHFHRLLYFLCSSPDVEKVEFAVYIDQDAMLHSELKLPRLLTVAIENSPACQEP